VTGQDDKRADTYDQIQHRTYSVVIVVLVHNIIDEELKFVRVLPYRLNSIPNIPL